MTKQWAAVDELMLCELRTYVFAHVPKRHNPDKPRREMSRKVPSSVSNNKEPLLLWEARCRRVGRPLN
jgi:hypothetical protein